MDLAIESTINATAQHIIQIKIIATNKIVIIFYLKNFSIIIAIHILYGMVISIESKYQSRNDFIGNSDHEDDYLYCDDFWIIILIVFKVLIIMMILTVFQMYWISLCSLIHCQQNQLVVADFDRLYCVPFQILLWLKQPVWPNKDDGSVTYFDLLYL